jgi:hypothetical protein
MKLLRAIVIFLLLFAVLSAAPLPEMADAEADVAELLQTLAGAAKDPWERAIYAAGAKEILASGDTVAFSLRAFDP